MPTPPTAAPTGDGPARRRLAVLGAPIDLVDYERAVDRIAGWSQRRESRYVCICNVHSVVTASADASFSAAIASADLATPDGAPVAWMLRRLGAARQRRVTGPDLMSAYMERAQETGESVYFYGSTTETLALLQAELRHRFPRLTIAGADSPPFRELTAAEDRDAVDRINASGAGTVWVSLGCPKQERWMANHRGQVRAVMIGVGAAFDFHSGRVGRAPPWMRASGLEWLHRLLSEPRRLWRRYLVTNTLFILGATRQLLFKS